MGRCIDSGLTIDGPDGQTIMPLVFGDHQPGQLRPLYPQVLMKIRYLFIAYFAFIFCQIVFFGPYVVAVIGTILFVPFTILMLVALLIIQYGLFFIGPRMKMILMFILGFAVDDLMLFVILSGMGDAGSKMYISDLFQGDLLLLGSIWSTGGGIAGLLFYRGLFYEKDKLRKTRT